MTKGEIRAWERITDMWNAHQHLVAVLVHKLGQYDPEGFVYLSNEDHAAVRTKKVVSWGHIEEGRPVKMRAEERT